MAGFLDEFKIVSVAQILLLKDVRKRGGKKCLVQNDIPINHP